jgi:hypothetical protein
MLAPSPPEFSIDRRKLVHICTRPKPELTPCTPWGLFWPQLGINIEESGKFHRATNLWTNLARILRTTSTERKELKVIGACIVVEGTNEMCRQALQVCEILNAECRISDCGHPGRRSNRCSQR